MWAIAIVFAVLLGWIGAVARLDAWWIAKRNVEEIEPVRNEEPQARKTRSRGGFVSRRDGLADEARRLAR